MTHEQHDPIITPADTTEGAVNWPSDTARSEAVNDASGAEVAARGWIFQPHSAEAHQAVQKLISAGLSAAGLSGPEWSLRPVRAERRGGEIVITLRCLMGEWSGTLTRREAHELSQICLRGSGQLSAQHSLTGLQLVLSPAAGERSAALSVETLGATQDVALSGDELRELARELRALAEESGDPEE